MGFVTIGQIFQVVIRYTRLFAEFSLQFKKLGSIRQLLFY